MQVITATLLHIAMLCQKYGVDTVTKGVTVNLEWVCRQKPSVFIVFLVSIFSPLLRGAFNQYSIKWVYANIVVQHIT